MRLDRRQNGIHCMADEPTRDEHAPGVQLYTLLGSLVNDRSIRSSRE